MPIKKLINRCFALERHKTEYGCLINIAHSCRCPSANQTFAHMIKFYPFDWSVGLNNFKTMIDIEKQKEIIESLEGIKHTFIAKKLRLSYGHWMYITKCKRPLTEKHIKELKRLKFIQ